MPALGLTDHGVMNGAVEHYKACRDERDQADPRPRGLPGRRPPRRGQRGAQPPDPARVQRRRASATSSSSPRAAFSRAFAAASRASTPELLDRHSDGVIALTGCLQSRFCQRLIAERPARRPRAHRRPGRDLRRRERLLRDPGERARRSRTRPTRGSCGSARELGRPLVATADVHYLRREDYTHHAALLCVQTKSTIEQPEADASTPTSSSSRAPAEMAESFAQWPEAVPTTLEIAERCEVEIELGRLLLPRFPTPDGEEPGRDASAAGHRGPRAAATAIRRPPRRSSGSSSSSA